MSYHTNVADLHLTQPERRNYTVPIVGAAVALAVAFALAIHFFPATTVDIAHVHTDLLPTHTVFKANSIVVGQNQTEDTLYVAETVSIDNQLRVPIFLDGFTLTFTDAAGAELVEKAIAKQDLPNVEASFPALKPLLQTPLLPETGIAPGQHGQGTVLFGLQMPRAMWDARKSAVVKVELYHQNPVYQTIP